MKLVGDLKKQVEETKNKEQAKELIENAGMQLTEDELDNVTGGNFLDHGYCGCPAKGPIGHKCPICHQAYV